VRGIVAGHRQRRRTGAEMTSLPSKRHGPIPQAKSLKTYTVPINNWRPPITVFFGPSGQRAFGFSVIG
jgi:hypothetical protein